VGLLAGFIAGLPLAVLAALFRRGAPGGAARLLTILPQSIPAMVAGFLLIYVFALRQQALPAFGIGDIDYYILTSAVLALVLIPGMARAGAVFGEAWRGELGGRLRVLRAFGCALSVLLLELGAFIGTLAVVENIFAWPGIFRLLVTAVLTHDIPVVMTIVAGLAAVLAWVYVLGSLPRAIADFRSSSVALCADDHRALGARPDEAEPASGRRRYLRFVPSLLLLAIVLLIFLASFTPLVDPLRSNISQRLVAPGAGHILGTDALGRDVLSRVLVGARTALLLAFGVTLISAIGGSLAGAVAGLHGRAGYGWILAPLAWMASAARAIPLLVWLIVALASVGAGVIPFLAVSSAWLWTYFFGLTSGLVLDWNGDRDWLATFVGGFALAMGSALLIDGYVSFFGLGLTPPSPTLGGLLNDGRQVLQQGVWIQSAGLMLVFLAFSFNLLGDTLANILKIRRPF
jgi:peptide/nickel transport system permease protein